MPFFLPLAIFGGLAFIGYRAFLRALTQAARYSGPASGAGGNPVHEIEARACQTCGAFVAIGAGCNRHDCPHR
jgi:hypothetical protein